MPELGTKANLSPHQQKVEFDILVGWVVLPVIIIGFLWVNRISCCSEVTFLILQQILKKGKIIQKIAFTWSAASVFFCQHFFMVLLFRVDMTQDSSIIVHSPQISTKKTLNKGKMNPLKLFLLRILTTIPSTGSHSGKTVQCNRQLCYKA